VVEWALEWGWALRNLRQYSSPVKLSEWMIRSITATAILLWGTAALSHHSVIGIYDDLKRFTIEVEVRNFELANPHPLIFVEITDIPDGQEIEGIAVGQTWTIEMDNRRELTALGFDKRTFIPGDQLVIAVDPSRHTRYRENTLYLRAADHPREGFVYLHNVRELVPVDAAGNNLSKYLHRINN
jgi:hypothetical protein